MITRPETNFYVSDAGFSVEVLGRTGMLYREGDHVMGIYSEVSVPGPGIAIWAKTIRAWNPPFEAEAVTDEKREAIIRNIGEVVVFCRQSLTVMR